MGCSRKVTVARARELDIVVCRHSSLYAEACVRCAVCGVLRRLMRRSRARSGECADKRQTTGRAQQATGELAVRRGQGQRSAGQAGVVRGAERVRRAVMLLAWVVRKRARTVSPSPM
jgi:hypothetical protein